MSDLEYRSAIIHAMAGRTARHRALADPTRERLLDLLRAADEPHGGRRACRRRSASTRTRFVRICSCSRRRSSSSRLRITRGGRGRPSIVFSAVPADAEQEHALLAAVAGVGARAAARRGRDRGGGGPELGQSDDRAARARSRARRRRHASSESRPSCGAAGSRPRRPRTAARDAPLPVPRARRALPARRLFLPCRARSTARSSELGLELSASRASRPG